MLNRLCEAPASISIVITTQSIPTEFLTPAQFLASGPWRNWHIGARFTAVGVVTPDPASVESVLAWANRLQERVQYLIVQNATSPRSDFSYWDSAEQALRFREALSPIVIRMEFRLAELENPARQHGVRLGQVATRQNAINELKRASIVMRAESYRRRLFSEFDRAKEMFLP